ncbi:branched-chain amino acid ABC transporter substrate-binding protein [Poseidonibacter antarcticus]|uniref:branched-chain amino acid ABC transporter substrate-binding protein n=1 Tax=Poseidonibacter antarcticus TaxID=2478538 RepID=UPI000EF46160|nr:branched-chain amino acid ABC transporter substrate-binding protein [Poseidonibacter antarcticus]
MKIILFLIFIISLANANTLKVNILYLEQKIQTPPVLSNVIEAPSDLGIKGAQLSVKDSNRSSKFLNQNFNLISKISYDKKELIDTFEKFINENNSYVVLNVEDDLFRTLLKNPLSKKALLVNASSQTSSLRRNYCEDNLIHTIASNAMLYDGLVQFLVKRNFKKILLVSGQDPKDILIKEDMKHSIKKFGAKIIEEKVWDNKSDIRRKAGAEFPSFTQADNYDVILLADYYGDFGEFMYFNSWLPRPVAGTQGLTPVTWHKVIEQWGAAQMQKRFEKFASRWMESKDFSNWIAIRTIISSINQTKTDNVDKNIAFIRSKDFEIGAYMGRKVSFRDFNGQMRMPISLVQPRALISTSPQVGFLHPVTDLDTLGVAPYEMKCKK